MNPKFLYYPVKPSHVTQPFGVNGDYYRKNGINIDGHNGLDLRTDHGQPVYAAHNGTCYPEIDANGGNGVVIRSDEQQVFNGKPYYFKTVYWHLLKADAVVKNGQKVKAGDLIGYADNTGLSTGDHLHFALKPQAWNENEWAWYNAEQNNGYGGCVDPTPYFNGFYAIDATYILEKYSTLVGVLSRMWELIRVKQ